MLNNIVSFIKPLYNYFGDWMTLYILVLPLVNLKTDRWRFPLFPSVTFLCFIFSSFLHGQEQLQFNHYSLDQGYYNGIVTTIYQDKYHHLWIGTADGLYRYNGYQFKEYRKNTNDPYALKSNVVTAIKEDQQGHLWIGTEGAGLNLFDRKTNQFTQFRHDPNDPNSISSDFVTKILSDQKGNLWIGTEDNGLSVLQYNGEKNNFYFYNFGSPSQGLIASSLKQINDLFEDSNGNIWVGTKGGLARIRYDSLDELDITYYNQGTRLSNSSIANDHIYSIAEDGRGRIWIGTQNGLSCLNTDTDSITNYYHDPTDPFSLSNNSIRTIAVEDEERLWIGTNNGLNLFNITTSKSFQYHNNIQNPNSLSKDLVMVVFKDDQGSIWVGTWGEALNRINPLSRQVTHFPYQPGNPNSLSDPGVRSITEDTLGRVWVATNKGLDCIDRGTQKYTHYQFDEQYPSTEAFEDLKRIFSDRSGHIWIANTKGLFRLNPSTGVIKAFKHDPKDPNTLAKGEVWDVKEDSYGLIWIGIYRGGLACWDPSTEQLTHFKHNPFNVYSLSEDRVMEIYEDQKKNLWIGTYEGGITLIKRDDQGRVMGFERFQHDPNNEKSISSNVIWSFLEAPDGNFWVGTANGLNRFRVSDRSFKSYKEEDGLANNFVFGLLPGTEDRVWLSTNRGLSIFEPSNETFRNIDIRDGLQQNEFNRGAFWKGRNQGELFFGGVNGMILVRNEGFQKNKYIPNVFINRMVTYNSNDNLTKGEADDGIGFKKEVTLPYYKNTLEFEFAALNFINAEKNQFSYRLKGLSNHWINLGTNNTIRFGGVSPGSYTLEVKGSNNDGLWNEEPATLTIKIRPPWWLTFLAKVSYLLLGILTFWFIYRFMSSKKIAEQESERLREQDAFKNKLYTDITHEFRTPLTVISGMADLIKGNEKAKSLIKRNSLNLLQLVNQILDLKKLESGQVVFNNIQADIVRFTRYLIEPFHEYAQKQGINIQLLSSNKEIWMDFDPEVMRRILSNLVSNGIKYNNVGGEVNIQLTNIGSNGSAKLLMVVRDTGIGISQDQLKNVFKRFYQIRKDDSFSGQGTGVGLALVKEYVEALNGHIQLDSQLGEGTTFKIMLPISRVAERLEPLPQTINEKDISAAVLYNPEELEEIPKESINPDLARILVVEDNPDVIHYLKSCLSGLYNVKVKENGADGIQTALEEIPDLVISDIMMPQKDGFELVSVLKNDKRTSHIPVILLTAKSDMPTKLKGLEGGVDAFLTKPFNRQELLLHISKLLELRKKLQQRYQEMEWPASPSDRQTEKEDAFIQEVQQVIMNHLEDPDFGVNTLCKEIGLSRTQLHNKLKAVTDRSTSIYIRFIRLREAKRLLETTDHTIAEIAYAVGFKDPNYFTRTFNLEYGVSPSQFRR